MKKVILLAVLLGLNVNAASKSKVDDKEDGPWVEYQISDAYEKGWNEGFEAGLEYGSCDTDDTRVINAKPDDQSKWLKIERKKK